MPRLCPFCGNPIVLPEGQAKAKCTGGFECPSRLREYLYHFGSRGAMDIEGLGYKTVDALVSAEMIENPADIYRLTVEDLLTFEGWGDVSANKLIDAIERSKARPLGKLIFGLGIDHVGGTVARLLAEHFRSMDRLRAATADEIAEIGGIGPEIAGSVSDWFADADNAALIDRLAAVGVAMQLPDKTGPTLDQTLDGLTFVITGTVEGFTRDEAKAAVVDRGGKVTGSVSKSTDALIAGEKAGSKLARAEALGVPILDAGAFAELLSDGPGPQLRADN
jgi:DNA ligase (NAD+)